MAHLLIHADARRLPLPDGSVHCAVTSPPYFALRDYGTARWEGGDEGCDHRASAHQGATGQRADRTFTAWVPYRDSCGKCGARRVDRQIGLEATPDDFVRTMVAVFREVRRVLRDDGTCWVNLGDTYNSSPSNQQDGEGFDRPHRDGAFRSQGRRERAIPGLKPKDLIGIPWRVALALQADGWYLRMDVIWAKPNPMPESVTDRPTKSHEYLFLLSKRERYFYDADAVREDAIARPQQRFTPISDQPKANGRLAAGGHNPTCQGGDPSAGRNLRSVWSVATEAYPGAHFATYPRRLVEPCIKAGTSERGVCPECGAPWERETEPTGEYAEMLARARDGHDWYQRAGDGDGNRKCRDKGSNRQGGISAAYKTTDWRPTCPHDRPPVPAIVLDPFAGSGTTLVVAEALGRRAIGCDLSRDYLAMARRRIERPHAPAVRPGREEVLPLFDGAFR